jgi:hypothetical protein
MAITLSPKKEAFYMDKRSSIDWELNDNAAAQAAFNTAYALGPSFSDLAIYAAAAGDTLPAMRRQEIRSC